jgi:hypothetical protein
LNFKHVKDVANASTFSNNFGRTARKTLQNDDNNTEWVRDTTYFPCNNENPNDYGYNCYLLGTDLNTRSEFLNNTAGSGYIKGLEPSGKVIPNTSGTAYTTSLNFNNSDYATFYQDVPMATSGQNLFTPVEINDNSGRKILTIDTVTRLYYNNSSPVYLYSNYFFSINDM